MKIQVLVGDVFDDESVLVRSYHLFSTMEEMFRFVVDQPVRSENNFMLLRLNDVDFKVLDVGALTNDIHEFENLDVQLLVHVLAKNIMGDSVYVGNMEVELAPLHFLLTEPHIRV